MNNINFNLSNEQPSITAFIIIPTRLTTDALNVLCGLANAFPNTMPIASAIPQSRLLRTIH